MVNSLCMIGFKYIKACHKLFKWVKQHLMITNSISTSCSINIFYSFAMGNAAENIKQIARYATDDNNHEGALNVIQAVLDNTSPFNS